MLSLGGLFMSIWQTIIPSLEILILACVLNYLLSFFWNTRSMDLIIGALAFLVVFAFTSLFNLPVLNTIMKNVASVAAIAALVIFQPELRLALYKMSWKTKRLRGISDFDIFLDQLTNSVYRLADKKSGALIVLEREDKLNDFAQKAVMLNAQFSSELIESIFSSSSPLHDGAVILRGTTIIAAAVILPLADDASGNIKSTGTRHRAALGITQMTDALIIVISEETGKVAMAREGFFTLIDVKADRFKSVIRTLFMAPEDPPFKLRLSIRDWLRT